MKQLLRSCIATYSALALVVGAEAQMTVLTFAPWPRASRAP